MSAISSGIVGTHQGGLIDEDVKITKNLKKEGFSSKDDAIAAAKANYGSELVYEKDGKWFAGEVKEIGWLTGNEYDLEISDKSEIKINNKGISAATISFVENDNDILKQSQDSSNSVRQTLAKRTDLPDNVFMKLSNDNSSWIKETLIRNPATPIESLRNIAKNTNSGHIQTLLALRTDTKNDPEIKDKLVSSNSSHVRNLMAMSSQDFNEYKASHFTNEAQREKHSHLLEQANDTHSDVRRTLASRRDLPSIVYVELATDTHSDVRREVAQNPNASLDALRILANDTHSDVRMEVARHPKSHRDSFIGRQLVNDTHSSVRSAFAEGPRHHSVYDDPFRGEGHLNSGPEINVKAQENKTDVSGNNNDVQTINIQNSNVVIKQD